MTGLLSGIYNKFTELTGGNHNSLYNSVSGKMYLTEAPQGTTYPYIVYHLITGTQNYQFVENFEEVVIQFDIVSQNSSSTEANTIFGYLMSLYDECTLTVTGYSHIRMDRHYYSLDRYVEDNVWVYVSRYSVLIQKT